MILVKSSLSHLKVDSSPSESSQHGYLYREKEQISLTILLGMRKSTFRSMWSRFRTCTLMPHYWTQWPLSTQCQIPGHFTDSTLHSYSKLQLYTSYLTVRWTCMHDASKQWHSQKYKVSNETFSLTGFFPRHFPNCWSFPFLLFLLGWLWTQRLVWQSTARA